MNSWCTRWYSNWHSQYSRTWINRKKISCYCGWVITRSYSWILYYSLEISIWGSPAWNWNILIERLTISIQWIYKNICPVCTYIKLRSSTNKIADLNGIPRMCKWNEQNNSHWIWIRVVLNCDWEIHHIIIPINL